jgi:ferritin
MLKETLVNALSDQVNAEYFSAYLYLSMYAEAERMGFKGIANWLRIQAKEEIAHGSNMLNHIIERGASPTFKDIKFIPIEYKNMESIFEKVLSHERYVTELINNIATLAMKENDHATYNFIMWYVNEQIEEESTAADILTKIKMIGDNSGLLYNLDTEMGTRTFVAPFQTT